MSAELKFAVFIDYDNIAIGVKNTLNRSFDYKIVSRWLKQRGEVLAQIAYGNWNTHSDFRIVSRGLAKQGVRMEHLETASSGSKNGADIALSIDALELVFTQKHIDAFCILSGDSDFLPLVHKLKKHNKRVYVVAGNSFTSDNLRRNCHEFLSYEELCGLPPARYASSRVKAPLRGETQLEPFENAVPAVRRALREMERRGEIPYIKQLRTSLIGIEPAFDERAYGCESFKALIIKLVNSGHFRRKTIGENRFCIAEADVRPTTSLEARRNRGGGGGYGRGLSGRKPAGQFDYRRGRSTLQPLRGSAETDKAATTIRKAVSRIEYTGRLAGLDLLYKTILEIDPEFRTYGCSGAEFRRFIGNLARQGHFRIKASSGAYVVELKNSAESSPVQSASRLGENARRLLVEVLHEHDSLVRTGVPNKQLELIISMQSRFDAAKFGVESPGHLLELAVREGLVNARRDASGVVRYFSLDAGEEMLEALGSRSRTRPLRGAQSSDPAAPAPKRVRRTRPVSPSERPAPSESVVGIEPSRKDSVDRAVEIVCNAVRTDGRLFDNGLYRSELRAALQKAEPGFDQKTYGIRTFRVLLDHVREKGFLETREEADEGMRYFGTDLLGAFGLPPADGFKSSRKGFLSWLRR